MWFFIAILGYILLAIVLILDKRILSKQHTTPAVFAFYSTIFLLPIGLAWFFGVSSLYGWYDWLIALISGITFGLGLLWMFKAVEHSEASHLDPFIGGIVTITTLPLAYWWINESLTDRQMIGIGILALASLLLSFKKKRIGFRLERGLLWAVLSGVAWAVFNVSSKYLYTIYPFWAAFVATRFTIGVFGALLLFAPSVLKSLFHKNNTPKKKEPPGALGYIAADKILAIVGATLLQFAVAEGSVTVVNALGGLQYGFMFVLIVLLSKFRPGVFKESFTKRELILQTVAIILIVIGLAFVV